MDEVRQLVDKFRHKTVDDDDDGEVCVDFDHRADEVPLIVISTPRIDVEKEIEYNSTEIEDSLQRKLDWLKAELLEMRENDEHLAKCFLKLRSDLQQIRLNVALQNHEEFLFDITDDEKARRQRARMSLCDSTEILNFPGATDFTIRVTRQNSSGRRFSLS